jgi:hypothetical protein
LEPGGIPLGQGNEVINIDIDFGYGITTLSSDGELYDTFAGIGTMDPVVTVTGYNPLWLADGVVPLAGLSATQANTTVYLRKRAAGATFVADETAEHISLAFAGLARVTSAFESSDRKPGMATIAVEVIYDGTLAPFVVDTTAAIT